MKTASEKKHGRIRLFIQLAATVLFNGYLTGFAKGTIFNGRSKSFCVPVLNCYSCPGALGSCPIGALQTTLGHAGRKGAFYALGLLMLFGIAVGRLWCGFICPFGFIQDLLHKIPSPKVHLPRKIDRPLRYLKYAILLLFVILLPLVATNGFGLGLPYFCQFICPAGTLQAGIPLIIKNPALRGLLGFLFSWKMLILVIVMAGSILIPRCFCRYMCPLGAIYGLFNRFSLYQMKLDQHTCISCGKCEQVCPMAVDIPVRPAATGDRNIVPAEHAAPTGTSPAEMSVSADCPQTIASPECIRCGKCTAACPTRSITSSFTTGRDQKQPSAAP